MGVPKPNAGRRAIDVAEEAFHLLRGAGAATLPYYFIGSAPFVIGAVYYWADLSRHPFATEHVALLSLAMALLFAWMKAWQSVFTRRLLSVVSGVEEAPQTLRGAVRMTVRQTFAHALGLLLLPFAALIALPFGWVYALLQSYTVLEDGSSGDPRESWARAWRAANLWPAQNHLLIWLCSPWVFLSLTTLYAVILPIMTTVSPQWASGFVVLHVAILIIVALPLCPIGIFIAANIGSAIVFIPWILQTLTGVRTLLSDGPANGMNTTFLVVVGGLTYLCLDPLMKAAYVLRCFHGASVQTGDDLRQGLRAALRRAAAGGLLLLALGGGLASAQESPAPPTVDPAALNQALDTELASSDYAWRTVQPNPLDVSESPMARFVRAIGAVLEDLLKRIGKAFEWVMDRFEDLMEWLFGRKKSGPGFDAPASIASGAGMQVAMSLLVAGLVLLLAYLAYRVWRDKQLELKAEAQELSLPTPDLHDESTSATDLPEEEWRRLARELIERGDYRLAARAFFLATLALLAERELIRVTRAKSNLEYRRELARYAHQAPELLSRFTESTRAFESVWYGAHPCGMDTCALLEQNREAMAAHA